MNNKCSFCGDVASEALSVRHFGCNHVTHADCMPNNPTAEQSERCCQCLGVEANMNLADRPALTLQSRMREPRLKGDNRDYQLNPGTRQTNVAVSALMAVASFLPGRVPNTVETSRDPVFLVANQVSVGDMMRINEIGLDHILRAGVTMDDFLRNHYTWDDLLQFEDVGHKGATRALQTLCIGMRANANHFRDYPDAFPFERVKAHTQMEKSHLCEYFGLTFPHNGPLECRGDQMWNAGHCAKLGLNFDDLVDFGMRYIEQYKDLIAPMTLHQVQQAERTMGITPERLTELVCLKDCVAAEYTDVSMQQQQQVAAVVKVNTTQYPPAAAPRVVYYQQPVPVKSSPPARVLEPLVHQPRRVKQQQQQPVGAPVASPPEQIKINYKHQGARAAARHGAVFLQ